MQYLTSCGGGGGFKNNAMETDIEWVGMALLREESHLPWQLLPDFKVPKSGQSNFLSKFITFSTILMMNFILFWIHMLYSLFIIAYFKWRQWSQSFSMKINLVNFCCCHLVVTISHGTFHWILCSRFNFLNYTSLREGHAVVNITSRESASLEMK